MSSYEPLHHKYRPQTFADLVGQEAIATTLTNAIVRSRIAPAYLFTGPRGTGKTSSARILAKSLNCLRFEQPSATPCGKCEVCRAIALGTALDVMEIDAASNTGVDNIREIIERAQFAPVQCRYKVYVIDECLTGNSLIQTSEGLLRIDHPKLKGKMVLSYNDVLDTWEYKKVLRWLKRGIKKTVIIKTNNYQICCTKNHLIRTNSGWIQAENVKEGMKILSPVNADVENLSTNSVWMDASADLFRDTNLKAINTGKNYTIATFLSPQWTTNLEVVESVHLAGVEAVYDIEVEDNHNFVANGLLVHNCHMLSVAAFNALLKTLEEPPARVVFILATTDPQRVLPTIISRCQRFDYRRIPLIAMADHLSKIAYQESIDITPEAITLVAQIANGGLRDAESLLDQLSLLEGTVTPEKVWDLVGAVSERELLGLLEAIAADNPETLLDCCRNLMNRGREPLAILQNLAGFYLNLLIAKTAPNRSDLAALTSSTWQQLQSQAQAWELNTLLQGQQHLKDSEAQLKNTTQPRLWLEVTLLGLLPSACGAPAPVQRETPAIPAISASVPLPTKLDASQPAVAQTNLPSSQPEPEITSVSSSVIQVGSIDLAQTWQSVLAHLQPFTQALVRPHCYLISLEQATARVGVRNEHLLRHAQGKIAEIETALEAVCQRRLKVSLQIAPPPELVEVSPTQAVKLTATIEVPSPPVAPPSPPHANQNNGISSGVDAEPSPPPAKVKPLLPVPSPPIAVETASDLTETEVKKAADSLAVETSSDLTETEVKKAAVSLAKVFDGEIIILNDGQEAEEVRVRTQVMPLEQEAAMTSQPGSSSSWEVSDSPSEPSVIRGRPVVADLSEEEDIPF